MKLFACGACGQMLHFENSSCLACGAPLGFRPDRLELATLDPLPAGCFRPIGGGGDDAWVFCANAASGGCNWLVPLGGDAYCPACGLNRTIPDLDIAGNAERWRAIETAKRRLIYALRRFGLPMTSQHEDAGQGLAFDFLADAGAEPVMTGHADGLVTINIAEADSAERERRRLELGEPYRTLLGHLRHEVGHYYWDLLVRDGGRLEAARAVFGDERADYAEALERHYATGPQPDWQSGFVSAYATMHPWEDFAETWTHYFHMVDTLDTAASFGLALDPQVTARDADSAGIAFDPYRAPDCRSLVDAWLPLTVALNSLNRSMGQPDLYPFVLSAPAIAKLGFVHDLVQPPA